MFKKIVQAIVISLIAKKVTDYLTRDKFPRLALEYEPSARRPHLLREKSINEQPAADVEEALPGAEKWVDETESIAATDATTPNEEGALKTEATLNDEITDDEIAANGDSAAGKTHTPVTVNEDGSKVQTNSVGSGA